jgi:hypothetical protein
MIGDGEEYIYSSGGYPEGKRPLGRTKRGWICDIKMDLGETGWGGVDWIGLVEDRD